MINAHQPIDTRIQLHFGFYFEFLHLGFHRIRLGNRTENSGIKPQKCKSTNYQRPGPGAALLDILVSPEPRNEMFLSKYLYSCLSVT